MCPYVFGRRRTFPSEHFFCVLAAGASSLRNTFFATRGRPVPSAPLNSPSRPYPVPLNTLAPPPPAPQNPRLFRPRPAPGPTAERAGPAPAPPQNHLHCPRPAPLNTLAPPPGSTAEPPAPPCPAPLNALVPPRLHRRTPCPSPSRAAEHAGPLPVVAPETSPKGRNTPPKALFGAICRKVAPGVGYFVEYFVPLNAKNVFCSQ